MALRKLPVIVTDIDGVLLRGRTPITGTWDALLKIRELQLPFTCLTNGGGCTEQVKADKMNKIFNSPNYFSKDNVILNHTPLKPELLKESRKGLLMITGSMDIISIVEDLGIQNYITADEVYTMIVHELPPELQRKYYRSDIQYERTREVLSKRKGFNLPHNSKTILNNVEAVFTLNDVSPYETTMLVLDRLYRSREKTDRITIPYYTSQNDLVWASTFPLMRLAMGPFTRILEKHCQEYLGKHIEPIVYGKPTLKAFSYVKQYMESRYSNTGNFYMIGDNPKADIRGANNAGWISLMTRTGVFKGTHNDEEDPATYVVQNFEEAIDKILSIEGIKS